MRYLYVFMFLVQCFCPVLWLAETAVAQSIDVKVVNPTVHEFKRVSNQPATAAAYYVADLGAQVSGYVEELLVDIGDRVRKGTVLARISVPDIDESLRAAQASVTALESEFQRVTQLVEESSLTAKAADEAKHRLDSTRAELRRLEAVKAYGVIRAPFDGVITARNIDPGDVVFEARSPKGDDQPLLKVAALDTIRVTAYIPEKDAVLLNIGDKARVVFDAFPGKAFSGLVARMAGVLDPATRSMTVEIDIPNQEGIILPGLYGRVEIELEARTSAFSLPATAVRFGTDGAYVYVADVANKARQVPVEIGLDDGVRLEITSGLSGDERIVNGVIGRLRDGETVNVVQN